MAARYYRGPSSTVINFSNSAQWADSPGGSTGFTVSSADIVYFDATSATGCSFSSTYNTYNCAGLNFTGFTGSFNTGNATSININITGDLIIPDTMSFTGTCACNFNLNSTGSSILDLSGPIRATTINVNGGTYTLQTNAVVYALFNVSGGTLNFNSKNLAIRGFVFSSGSMTNYSASTVEVRHDTSGTVSAYFSNYAFSKIILRSIYSTFLSQIMNVSIVSTTTPVEIYTSTKSIRMALVSNLNVPSLTVTGNSINSIIDICTNTKSTQRTITCNGTITVSNARFTDIIASGSGSWNFTGNTSVLNGGYNSNITFDSSAPANRFYYVSEVNVTGPWIVGPFSLTPNGAVTDVPTNYYSDYVLDSTYSPATFTQTTSTPFYMSTFDASLYTGTIIRNYQWNIQNSFYLGPSSIFAGGYYIYLDIAPQYTTRYLNLQGATSSTILQFNNTGASFYLQNDIKVKRLLRSGTATLYMQGYNVWAPVIDLSIIKDGGLNSEIHCTYVDGSPEATYFNISSGLSVLSNTDLYFKCNNSIGSNGGVLCPVTMRDIYITGKQTVLSNIYFMRVIQCRNWSFDMSDIAYLSSNIGTTTSNITITGNLTLNGFSSTKRLYWSSNIEFIKTPNTFNRYTLNCNGTVTGKHVNLSCFACGGSASWNLSAIEGGCGDAGGNTGLTATTPRTIYYIGNGGSLSDTTHLSLTSNGTAGEYLLPQDTLIFDSNSFSSIGQTVTTDVFQPCKNIICSNVLNSPTFSITDNLQINGSLDLSGFSTINNNSKQVSIFAFENVTIKMPSSQSILNLYLYLTNSKKITLNSNLSISGIFYVVWGDIAFNGYNLTSSSIIIGSSAMNFSSKTGFDFTSGNLILTSSGNILSIITLGTHNIIKGTGSIQLTDNSAAQKRINQICRGVLNTNYITDFPNIELTAGQLSITFTYVNLPGSVINNIGKITLPSSAIVNFIDISAVSNTKSYIDQIVSTSTAGFPVIVTPFNAGYNMNLYLSTTGINSSRVLDFNYSNLTNVVFANSNLINSFYYKGTLTNCSGIMYNQTGYLTEYSIFPFNLLRSQISEINFNNFNNITSIF